MSSATSTSHPEISCFTFNFSFLHPHLAHREAFIGKCSLRDPDDQRQSTGVRHSPGGESLVGDVSSSGGELSSPYFGAYLQVDAMELEIELFCSQEWAGRVSTEVGERGAVLIVRVCMGGFAR
ncbi:hypothetical protein HPP92_029152 [Vanilla planifolia]|uniref:Uncharacterized protein n=1 Tax=Vanilla planifolia TaxID=51239 RepID=A0A835P2U4_VANPL|nr:hypothetical protein HPP92_029152 [Vanilla planifolia]KAG0445830.1 hypothetical protein HPP92_029141 [Vanilla planifolia]